MKYWNIPAGKTPRKCDKCPEMIYDVAKWDTSELMQLSVAEVYIGEVGEVWTHAAAPSETSSGLGFSHFSNCGSPSNWSVRVPFLKSSGAQTSLQTPTYGSPFAGRWPSAGSQGVVKRCPKCGARNFADEWYCNRCGGELSAAPQSAPTPPQNAAGESTADGRQDFIEIVLDSRRQRLGDVPHWEAAEDDGWLVFSRGRRAVGIELDGTLGVLSPSSWAVKTPAGGWLFDKDADAYSGDLQAVVYTWSLVRNATVARQLRTEAAEAWDERERANG